MAFWDEFKKRNANRVKRVRQLRTLRITMDLSAFIDTRGTCLKCDGTFMDIENEFWELQVGSDSGMWESRDSLWEEHAEEAQALLRKACPDMPARVVSRYTELLQDDMLRAMEDAANSDYCDQFNRYMASGIEDAIDDALPAGAAWSWADKAGNPTTEYYDSDRIVIAMPHRAAVNPNCELWEHYSYTAKVRREHVAEILEEYVKESTRGIAPEQFDDRGGLYGDSDEWPTCFADLAETPAAWRKDVREMRAKLRQLIRARAPLHVRAALVATVYGEP